MIGFLIVGIILVLASFIVCAIEESSPFSALFALMGMFFICIYFTESNDNPKAIDVYRGNTTLKISYVDSVATDSVVVWKNKKQ